MKEIGTLIELLNEYENRDEDQQIEWRIGEGDEGESGKVRGIVNDVYMGWVSELVVCSNRYGFIKWLVENDRINFDEVSKKEIESRISIVMEGMFIETKWVLMLLSISDTPIEDLISYLK